MATVTVAAFVFVGLFLIFAIVRRLVFHFRPQALYEFMVKHRPHADHPQAHVYEECVREISRVAYMKKKRS